MSLTSQEYGWKLASTWQCRVAHTEDWGIHYKIWWELLPHPPYSTELAPSDFHQFRALKDAIYGTEFETWWYDSPSENLAKWLEQGMVLSRHTHILSSLVQGRRSGWRHCGKIGHGAKPSLFIICNFYDLGINIYLETKWGHCFLGRPHTCWRRGCQSIEISWLLLHLYLNGSKYLLLQCCLIFGSSLMHIDKCFPPFLTPSPPSQEDHGISLCRTSYLLAQSRHELSRDFLQQFGKRMCLRLHLKFSYLSCNCVLFLTF